MNASRLRVPPGSDVLRYGFALPLLLLLAETAAAQPTDLTEREIQLNRDIRGLAEVRSAVERTDRPIRVLAQFSQATVREGGSPTITAPMAGLPRGTLSEATRRATSALREQGVTRVSGIEGLPLVTFELRADQLNAIAESGQFAIIVEDRLAKPYLASSGEVVGVPELHALNATGDGTTVAILDTGVDVDHPFLNGRVVEGACFSSNFAPHGATSLCPDGADSATTVASGNHCSGPDGCDHGTHVAGIAAGRPGGGISITGVAPDANIMAVQVFSRFDDVPGAGPTTCADLNTASPCVLSYTSDQIRGLQRVVERATDLDIVAANMSLGGGMFSGECDTDGAALKAIIDQLLNEGAVTVIAAGNDGLRDAIGSPGCISTAVTIGSTTDQDSISGFSNLSDTVDMLAPGSNIESSVPGTGLGIKSGTSMATPQVAGAFAALASCPNSPDVAAIRTALINAGVAVPDARPGGSVTKRRIDLDAAAAAIGCGVVASDCVGHNVDNLELESTGWWIFQRWFIVDGSRQLFAFGRQQAEAREALNVIRQFRFTQTCYIGRPDPSMQYLLAGSSAPGGAHGSRDCLAFNRTNLAIEQVSGDQWRLTDGTSSVQLFPDQNEAQQAMNVINRYSLNRQCFVGRPDPSFTWWLAE